MRPALAFLFPALLLPACSMHDPPFSDRDYGPAQPVDVSHVPDAVPRDVPRSRYGNPASYTVRGKTYHVMSEVPDGFRQRGEASWYGLKFHGRRTSSGEAYDMYAMTAAHKTLPLPSWVRVTNLENGRSVVVKVNDRGPFHPGRIIDLSYAAASKLGVLARGTAPVEIAVVKAARKRASAPATQGHYVQAGAFASLSNARSLQRRLGRVQESPVEVSQEGELHRVVIGPLDNPADRRRLERILEAWGIRPHALVVQ